MTIRIYQEPNIFYSGANNTLSSLTKTLANRRRSKFEIRINAFISTCLIYAAASIHPFLLLLSNLLYNTDLQRPRSLSTQLINRSQVERYPLPNQPGIDQGFELRSRLRE